MHYLEEKINNVTFKFVRDYLIEEDFESKIIGNNISYVSKEIFEKYAKWCEENKELLPFFSTKQKYIKDHSDILFYVAYNMGESTDIEYCKIREEYCITNTDIIVAFAAWVLNQEFECSIVIKYHHIMWFFHDLMHIQYDVDETCKIHVTPESEYNAIFTSLIRCEEEKVEIDVEYACLIEMYNRRFNKKSGDDFERFFIKEDEEDEEEYFCMVCNNDGGYCMICGYEGDEEEE